jgi:hypothetical protein
MVSGAWRQTGATEPKVILFIVPDGGEYPLRVSHKYREELNQMLDFPK